MGIERGDWGSYGFLFGPLVSFVILLVIVLLMRWTFSRGRSLVARPARPGDPGDYGLLIRVAAPATVVEAEMIRLRLVEHGLRATLAPTTHGPAVMVFREDEAVARRLLEAP